MIIFYNLNKFGNYRLNVSNIGIRTIRIGKEDLIIGNKINLLSKLKFPSIDVHSKAWWGSLILVFGQQVGHLFGWEITSDQVNQIMGIVNTIFLIGGLLGLITDTSKNSVSTTNTD